LKREVNRKKKRTSSRRRTRATDWSAWSDEELLDLRFRDLDLRIAATWLEEMIAKLYDELEVRGLRFRPHCWLSSEWFSPDGVPGIAIPFYLAHPRFMKLERRQMLDVEGGTKESCMRILRHEAGHAIDTAYRLRRRRKWREVFGKGSEPYPDSYQPEPYSRDFVLHLDWWYAQSHPLEDFAETFAVWLKPGSRWRRRYRGWPALKKIEFVDRLMGDIASEPARVRSRQVVDPIHRLNRTLRAHYRGRHAHYGADFDVFDRDLLRLFARPEDNGSTGGPSALAFLRKERRALRELVAEWSEQHPYLVDQFLNELITRCRALRLRLEAPEPETRLRTAVLLTVQVMSYLQHGGHPIAL